MTREEAILLLHDMKDTYDEIHENTNYEIGYEQMTALDMAIEALSADRPHGEWYNRDSDGTWATVDFAYCSECKQPIIHKHASPLWHFCPNCGAKMKGGAE